MTAHRIALLLVPGLACDAAVWQPQLDHFSQHPDIDVHVADLGLNDSTQAMAQALWDRYPGQLAVAGFSLGGYVAQEMAHLVPERLLGLALLATQAGTDPPTMAAVRAGWIEQARREGMDSMAQAFVSKYASSRYLEQAGHHRALLAMIGRHRVDAFCAEQEAIRTRSDRSNAVAGLGCPKLAVIPMHDALVTPVNQHQMAVSCAIKSIQEIADSGHTVMLEAPQAVNFALQGWLDQIRAGQFTPPL
jgi:pimeloyl-ACP methyl ester carboxylesterase